MTGRPSSAGGRFENRESGCKMLGETFRGYGERWVSGSRDDHRSWRGSKRQTSSVIVERSVADALASQLSIKILTLTFALCRYLLTLCGFPGNLMP